MLTLHSIYFIRMTNTEFVKVGYSINPEQRKKTLQVGNPCRLLIEFTYPTAHPVDLETQIKRNLVSKLVLGEWFTISTDTDYQNIIQNAEKDIEQSITDTYNQSIKVKKRGRPFREIQEMYCTEEQKQRNFELRRMWGDHIPSSMYIVDD